MSTCGVWFCFCLQFLAPKLLQPPRLHPQMERRDRLRKLLAQKEAEGDLQTLAPLGAIVVEEAPVQALFASPQMPYTEGLLAAMPRLHPEAPPARLTTIPGTVPSPEALPSGCAFRDRCAYAWDRCAREEPALHQVGSAHRARCQLVQEPHRRVPRSTPGAPA